MCRILIVIFLFSFTSCKEEIIRPDMPEDRLVELLADLHMVEMAMHQIPKHAKDSIQDLFKSQILDIYKINEEELVKNIDVLQSDPAYYYEVSKKVAELTKKEKQAIADLEKAKKEEKSTAKPSKRDR